MPSRATLSRRSCVVSPPSQSPKHPGGEGARAGPSPPSTREPHRSSGTGLRRWAGLLVSMVGSVVLVLSAGALCALMYPILKELRAERVKREDGSEERMLGFWSLLVLSALAGCISCLLSWTLTSMNSCKPDNATPTHCRDLAGHGCYLNYGVALLNGVMAMLTVVWSLS